MRRGDEVQEAEASRRRRALPAKTTRRGKRLAAGWSTACSAVGELPMRICPAIDSVWYVLFAALPCCSRLVLLSRRCFAKRAALELKRCECYDGTVQGVTKPISFSSSPSHAPLPAPRPSAARRPTPPSTCGLSRSDGLHLSTRNRPGRVHSQLEWLPARILG